MLRSAPPTLKSTRNFLLLVGTAGCLLAIYNFLPISRVSSQPQPLKYFRNEAPGANRVNIQLQNTKEAIPSRNPIYTDYKECAYAPTSLMYMVDTKRSFSIGDEMLVDIIVKDHLGRRKTRGGDMVRVWIKDFANHARSAGRITDNKDGTYRGVVKLLWDGTVTIVARITASRELIQLVTHNVKNGRSKRQSYGKFEKGSTSEVTNCTAMTEISHGYKMSCDLTYMNANVSWYCEKPKILSCEDWVSFAFSCPNRNYSYQEMKIFQSVVHSMNLKTTMPFKVKTGFYNSTKSLHVTTLQKPMTRCYDLPAKYTWTLQSPVGYMYQRRWYSTQCRNTFDRSVSAVKQCLSGRKLWLFGDSTLKQFLGYLMHLCKLKLRTKECVNLHLKKPCLAFNTNETIIVFWAPHALPYNNGPNFATFQDFKGPQMYIDNIRGKSRDIIVIHFYLHLLGYNTSVLRSRVRKTVDSLRALIARAPEVKVVVKGSHTFDTLQRIAGQLYDFWGVIYDQILKEEFAPVADKVIFLDVWDITMATESWDRHVNNTVLSEIIYEMMGFVCP